MYQLLSLQHSDTLHVCSLETCRGCKAPEIVKSTKWEITLFSALTLLNCLVARDGKWERDGSWAKCLLAGEPVVDRWCLWEKLAACRVSHQENAHANAKRLTNTNMNTWAEGPVRPQRCNTPSQGLRGSVCSLHNTSRWDWPQRMVTCGQKKKPPICILFFNVSAFLLTL